MKRGSLSSLGWPALLWFFIFLIGPLGLSFVTAFLKRGLYGGVEWTFTFENFHRVFEPQYLFIFLESLKLAGLNTLFCLALGFVMAWAIATARPRLQTALLALVTVPFLMNLIIRVYAIRIFVAYDGPLLHLLRLWGVGVNPFAFSQNQFLVFYGLVTSYLPFMVFPLYASLEKFDFSLVEAAYDLGGGPWQALTKVLIPLCRPAIASGCLMVFVPSMGEFVIPDLLGGAKTMLVGNLVTEQFLKSRNWPFGSALAVVLMIFLMLVSRQIMRWGRNA